jgi:hypothetical protein
MHVAVVGSREFPRLDAVEKFVGKLKPGTTVVSGGARGVDQAAATAARKRGLPVVEMLADWNQYGKAAGPIRNGWIADYLEERYPDCYLASFVLEEKAHELTVGSRDMIGKAKKAKLPYTIYRWVVWRKSEAPHWETTTYWSDWDPRLLREQPACDPLAA